MKISITKKYSFSKWITYPLGAMIILTCVIAYLLSFKGNVENTSFSSNDIVIDGAIITPKGEGPFPGILLLHGSGGKHQTYDKMSMRIHANYFVKRGFAVMVYTKRGSGNNTINYGHVTFEDLIQDALTAVKVFRDHPKVNPGNIGLRGLSESGWLTPEIAQRDGDIKFIINRVSPVVSWQETVIHEVRNDALADGFTPEETENELVPLIKRRWKFYIDAYLDNESMKEERKRLDEIHAALQDRDKFKDWFGSKMADYNENSYASKFSRYSYDPQPFLKEIDIPILFIYGGKDQNIPTKECLAFVNEMTTSGRKNWTVKLFPEADHYLYRWRGFPIEGFYVEGYLETMGDWAQLQIK